MVTLLSVKGMLCGNCARHVQSALEELEGVEIVRVELELKQVHVSHDERATVDSMVAAVEEAGYSAAVVV